MDGTWASRGLPVLEAIVGQVDELPQASSYPEAAGIAHCAGMQVLEVVAALTALDGSCLTIRRSLGPSGRDVTGVAPEARRAVGQWPAGESLTERLATGISQAAGHEKGPGQKRRLSVARGLGGAAKAIAINVASEMLERVPPAARPPFPL